MPNGVALPPGKVEFAEFSPEEQQVVNQIVARAAKMKGLRGARLDRLSLEMDLAAVHVHTPLRLADFLAADDFDFNHDVWGIQRHIDRKTGLLMDHFFPRFARY
ncbi:MAG: DUF6874 family protein [Sulfobacillus sp.]